MRSEESELKKKVVEIIDLLEKVHPDAKLALKWSTPLELLVATILSAQCTDERVNRVTEHLFKKYRTAEDYANADLEEFEQDIRSISFYRSKARNIKKACQVLVEKYNSEVPKTMEDLLSLPGVARKTANVVLSNAYGILEGIIVDTHVRRVSRRLGLTEETDSYKVEKDLMKIVPREKWLRFADLLIFHGRRICKAKNPKCDECILNKICPSASTS
ncbi:MAG TPA: endonuclease III [Candidatus Bathyarchaeota archaeon]|nr:endonuclease III [Candidatus Bathyarchaeota archaeon]